MKAKNFNKVFCIGLNKTGTSSLNYAFKILELNSVHFVCKQGNIQLIIAENKKANRDLLTGINEFDAYSDWLIEDTQHLFKELDEQYPGSKFIYTRREVEGWIASRKKHLERTPNIEKLRAENPDNPWYNAHEDRWRQNFINHENDVLDYFKDRPQDLLVFDITKGDGWNEVCGLLELAVPDKPFPHKNKANRNKAKERWENRLKKYIVDPLKRKTPNK